MKINDNQKYILITSDETISVIILGSDWNPKSDGFQWLKMLHAFVSKSKQSVGWVECYRMHFKSSFREATLREFEIKTVAKQK